MQPGGRSGWVSETVQTLPTGRLIGTALVLPWTVRTWLPVNGLVQYSVIWKDNGYQPIPRGSGETVFVIDNGATDLSTQLTELCTVMVVVGPLITTLAGVMVGAGLHTATVPRSSDDLAPAARRRSR